MCHSFCLFFVSLFLSLRLMGARCLQQVRNMHRKCCVLMSLRNLFVMQYVLDYGVSSDLEAV